MQVKQFWPPTKHKLFYANLIVYGAIFFLLFMFHHNLIWASRASRFYISTGILDTSKDNQLIQEAMSYLKAGNIKQGEQLLNKSIEINPYTQARLLLGLCYLKQGDEDKMLECYNEYRRINPSFINSYTQMISVLENQKDTDAINRLLKEGIEYFSRRVATYKPHIDPTVAEEFNIKASRIYNESVAALNHLKSIQEQRQNSD